MDADADQDSGILAQERKARDYLAPPNSMTMGGWQGVKFSKNFGSKSRFLVAICVENAETVATNNMLVARGARIGGKEERISGHKSLVARQEL